MTSETKQQQQQQTKAGDDVEGGSAVPELTRGAVEVTGGPPRVTAVPWGCLTALAAHAHIGWEFLAGAGRQDERGMWWRTVTQAAMFGVQEHRHESPITPGRKGQLSIHKINLRLADFQEEIRWRDAGGSVSSKRDI